MAVTTNENLKVNHIIASKALQYFVNTLGLAKLADRQYSKDFASNTGATINIRKPNRFTSREGAVANPQAIIERVEPLVCNLITGIDVSTDSLQNTLYIDNWMERVLRPAMQSMANKVNVNLFATAEKVGTFVGDANSYVNSFARVNAATSRLRGLGVQNPFYGVYSVKDSEQMQNSLQNSFNEVLNKDISSDATIGRLAHQDMHYDQSVKVHVGGVGTGTPAVNGAGQSGFTLVTDGWTASTAGIVQPGDLFTIAGVYEVNPETRQTTGRLKGFAVDAVANSGAGGATTITLSEEIILTGPYQNVTNAPADNALITLATNNQGGLTTKNVVFNPDGFVLATVPLILPRGAAFKKTIQDPDLGVSMRMIEVYDGLNDVNLLRFDILYGVKCFPEYVVTVLSKAEE